MYDNHRTYFLFRALEEIAFITFLFATVRASTVGVLVEVVNLINRLVDVVNLVVVVVVSDDAGALLVFLIITVEAAPAIRVALSLTANVLMRISESFPVLADRQRCAHFR
jgi:hypothetical protein